MFAASAALVATAAYAQHRVSRFTAGAQAVVLTRTVLLVAGVAFGFLCAWPYEPGSLPALLAFLIGFGAVHFPAAFILFVKQERGAGKT